jgi:hypothetical protein
LTYGARWEAPCRCDAGVPRTSHRIASHIPPATGFCPDLPKVALPAGKAANAEKAAPYHYLSFASGIVEILEGKSGIGSKIGEYEGLSTST